MHATARLLSLLLISAAVAAGARAAREPLDAGATASVPPSPPRSTTVVATNGDSLARAAAGAAPFRSGREPPTLRFDPLGANTETSEGAPAGPPPPPRLSGVAAGSPPAAVLDGIAGADGPRIVQVGDTIGGFTVRRITRDGVVLVRDGVEVTLWLDGTRP